MSNKNWDYYVSVKNKSVPLVSIADWVMWNLSANKFNQLAAISKELYNLELDDHES